MSQHSRAPGPWLDLAVLLLRDAFGTSKLAVWSLEGTAPGAGRLALLCTWLVTGRGGTQHVAGGWSSLEQPSWGKGC